MPTYNTLANTHSSVAILASTALAFAAYNYRKVFIKSIYCNPLTESGATLECYQYMKPDSRHYWSIQIHLATCLPAIALATTQFIPAIRQKYPIIHRWIGRTCMVLAPIATITGLSLSETAFGSTFSTISGCSVLAVLILIGHYQAWTAIRAQKIHKHRTWMIRTWGWLGTIITMRPIIGLGVFGLTWYQNTFRKNLTSSILCERLVYMSALNTETDMAAPINVFKEYAHECLVSGLSASNISSLQHLFDLQMNNKTDIIPSVLRDAVRPGAAVLVPASFDSQRLDHTAALLDVVFGWALWIAIVIHVVLVELYLRHTRADHDRLKRVSDRLRKARGKTE